MNPMDQFSQWNAMGDSVDPYSWQQSQNAPKQTTTKKKNDKKGSKNQSFISSLISEVGGAGGALGGAAAGAAVGSAVPILGTAIGGLIGAGLGGFAGGTGGRLVENKVRDGEYRPGDALQEGAISGVLGAGPGQLAKLAKGGVSAVAGGGGRTLESALINAGEQPLKNSVSGKLTSKGNQMLLNQWQTVPSPVARATNPGQMVGELADIGVTKPIDAERIASTITGSNGLLTKGVIQASQGATRVPIGQIRSNLQGHMDEIGLVGKDAKSITATVDAQIKRLGGGADADPSQVLTVMKALESRAANLKGKGGNYRMATPEREDQAHVLLKVRDELEDGLYNVAGANKNLKNVLTPELRDQLVSLHPKNPKWSNYVDNTIMKSSTVGDLRSAQAPFVKAGKYISAGEDNAATFGGRAGNAIIGNNGATATGIGLNLGANIVKNPASRFAGSALRAAGGAAGNPISSPGTKGIIGRVAGIGGAADVAGHAYGSMRAGTPMFAASARDGQNEAPQDLESAILGAQGGGQGAMAGGMSPDMQQQEAGSPYTRENLMADMNRDPKHAQDYMDYFDHMDKIFSAGSQKPLNSTQQQQSFTAQSALDSLGQIASELEKNPNAAKLSALPGGSFTKSLTGTGSYGAAMSNAVDAIGRLRSGGAINSDEEKRFRTLLPAAFDDQETVQYKLNALNNIFQQFANPQAASSNSLEDALMSQGGYN